MDEGKESRNQFEAREGVAGQESVQYETETKQGVHRRRQIAQSGILEQQKSQTSLGTYYGSFAFLRSSALRRELLDLMGEPGL